MRHQVPFTPAVTCFFLVASHLSVQFSYAQHADTGSTTPADWRTRRAIAALSSDNPEIVALAMKRLGRLATNDAAVSATTLIKRSKEQDVRESVQVQLALAEALGKLRMRSDVHLDTLLELVSKPQLTAICATSIGSQGHAARRASKLLIDSVESQRGQFVTETFAHSTSFPNGDRLTNVASKVFEALGNIGIDQPADLAVLLTLVSTSDQRLEELPIAFRGIAAPQKPIAAVHLLAILNRSTNELERRRALKCLAELGLWSPAVKDALLPLVHHMNPNKFLAMSAMTTFSSLTTAEDATLLLNESLAVLDEWETEQQKPRDPKESNPFWPFTSFVESPHENAAAFAFARTVLRYPDLAPLVTTKRQSGVIPLDIICALSDKAGGILSTSEGSAHDALAELAIVREDARASLMERLNTSSRQSLYVAAIRALNSHSLSPPAEAAQVFAHELAKRLIGTSFSDQPSSQSGIHYDIVTRAGGLPSLLVAQLVLSVQGGKCTEIELNNCAALLRIATTDARFARADMPSALSVVNDSLLTNSAGAQDSIKRELRFVHAIGASDLSTGLLRAASLDSSVEAFHFGISNKVEALSVLSSRWGKAADRTVFRNHGVDVDSTTELVVKELPGALVNLKGPNGQELGRDFHPIWAALDLLGPIPLSTALDIVAMRYADPVNEGVYTFWAMALTDESTIDLVTALPWVSSNPPTVPRDRIDASRKLVNDLTQVIEHSSNRRLKAEAVERLMTVIDRGAWGVEDVNRLKSAASGIDVEYPDAAKTIAEKRQAIRAWYQRWDILCMIAVGGIALYLGLCGLVVLAHPILIVRASGLLAGPGLANALDNYKTLQACVKVVVAYCGPSVFARLSRPRAAWTERYREGLEALDDLEESVRSEYLKRKDVIDAWADSYAKGRVIVADLPESVRPRFFRESAVVGAWANLCTNGQCRWNDVPPENHADFFQLPAVIGAWAACIRDGLANWDDVPQIARRIFRSETSVLDSWVNLHLDAARSSLKRLGDDRQRPLDQYVPLPIAVDGNSPITPTPTSLRFVFGKKRSCVLICGEGGAGKTSLALRLAEWAMSESPSEHLFDHPVIVTILESIATTESLVSTIRSSLRTTVDSDRPIADDLVTALLERQRVLVVLDGFTELGTDVRNALLKELSHPDIPTNAIVITSRQRNAIEPIKVSAVLWPQPLSRDRLRGFLDALLRSGGANFDDDKLDIASRGLRELAQERAVTPLLARLYADAAISAARSCNMAQLPKSVPALMLAYVNELNREQDYRAIDVQRDAKAIAWEMLQETYRPATISRTAAIKALRDACKDDAELRLQDMEERLRIVRIVGEGRNHVQFGLDPLAEYLGAIRVFEDYEDDRRRWSAMLNRIDKQTGGPASTRGLLRAIYDVLAIVDELVDRNISMDFRRHLQSELARRLSPEDPPVRDVSE